MDDKESNTDLEQRVADRTKELATLNTIAQTVSQSLDLDQVLNDALDKVLEVLEFESGAIYLKNLETSDLKMACHRGLSEQFRLVVAKGIISARAAESGNPIIIDDLPKEADAPKEVVKEGYRSVASIPLVSKRQVQGVLTIASRQLCCFHEQDVDLLLSIGHQIGVAIENARLFDAEQRRAEQFRVITEVGRRITSILDIDEVLVQVVRLVQQAFGYYHVGIGLIEGDEVVYRVGAGILWDDPQFQFKPARLRVGKEGITGWVAATGEPLLVPDVSLEPRYVWMRGSRTRSELAVPLKAKGKVIGVLDAQSDQLDAFDEADLLVLQSLAHQAAIAIENARLFAQAEQRMQELGALYRAEEELNRAEEELYRRLRLDQVLQALVKVAADLLHAEKGALLVWDAKQERLVVGAARGFSPKTLAQMSFVPGEGLVGRVAISGEPMIVTDTLTEPGVTKRITEPEGIRSFVHVPIKIGGQVFGVFTVAYAQPRAFGDDHLRRCLALAQRAALAIENARLYEQAQQVATLEERQRLAQELHDSVTQSLYGVTLYGEAASRLLSSGDTELAADHLRQLQDSAQEALREMRLLIFQLRPLVLEKEGLVAALRARLEAVEGRAGLETEFKVEGEERLPPQIEEGLYRIAQEALNNALRHAQAHRIRVHLRQDEQMVTLEIADDGIGFDPKAAQEQGGLGLPGMEGRATRLGGRLRVKSSPGEGTSIRVEVDR